MVAERIYLLEGWEVLLSPQFASLILLTGIPAAEGSVWLRLNISAT